MSLFTNSTLRKINLGLTSKLDYIKDLGVGAISLSSIYVHDDSDGDFHIVDHTAVGSDVGTATDFRNLVETAHSKGQQ